MENYKRLAELVPFATGILWLSFSALFSQRCPVLSEAERVALESRGGGVSLSVIARNGL